MNCHSEINQTEEFWKEIPGFEGIYEASNLGRIRSTEGKTTENALHGTVHWKQRVLKQHFAKRRSGTHSDARITLWKNKRPHYFLVARLIAMTWCVGYEPHMTVNHIDGNPENNHATNLEWITRSQNIRKGFDDGLYKKNMKPILISINGKLVSFSSHAEASRALGKSNGYLSNMIKKQERRDTQK